MFYLEVNNDNWKYPVKVEWNPIKQEVVIEVPGVGTDKSTCLSLLDALVAAIEFASGMSGIS